MAPPSIIGDFFVYPPKTILQPVGYKDLLFAITMRLPFCIKLIKRALLSWSKQPECINVWLVTFFFGLCAPSVAVAQEENKSPSDNSPVTALRALLDNSSRQAEFLNPDEAFRLKLESAGDGMLVARFLIAKGYYLYRDKMGFTQIDGDAKLGPHSLPPGLAKHDDYFGNVEIYEDEVNVLLPVSVDTQPLPGAATIDLVATYQGCADKGICYPPIEKSFSIALPTGLTQVTQPGSPVLMTYTRLVGYLAAAFATGLLLSFTPCVLPLIPILSSVIAGQGRAIRRGRTGALSIAYVLGMAVTYTAIGAVAGATGEQLQAYFQNVWAIGAVSLILVLMALSLFGLYSVQIPGFLQSRLAARSDRLAGGTLGMIFILGSISALVVGACVSPLLISILSIAFLKGNPVLGGALMFSVALGMGVILICVGFGAAFLLPKAGPWMKSVQRLFGFMLLAVAIYLLGAIPAVPVLLLWAILLIGAAGYIGSKSLSSLSGQTRQVGSGVTLVLVAWGVLALVGGVGGKRDILQPVTIGWLQKNDNSSLKSNSTHRLAFTQVSGLKELDQYLASARADDKPVLLEYYADWCTDCVRMKKTTFSDPRVINALRHFIVLEVDITDPHLADSRAVKQRYNVFGPPAILFFGAMGSELSTHRLYGYRTADELLLLVNRI
jgi:thiol:disulfide interchange protein DsbD